MNQLRRALENFSLTNDDFVPYVSHLLRRLNGFNGARERSNFSMSSESSDDSCIEDQLKFERKEAKGRAFKTKVYKKRSLKKGLI